MKTEITPEIFEAEAMQHIDDLYRTALRLTREAGDADDLVQETYMQAWKSFAHYELGTNCRAWLYKILFNKFDHHRRKMFGTEHDGEYLPLASMSPWCILFYLSQCLWLPPLVGINWPG